MTNKLQTALIPVAEAAGESINPDFHADPIYGFMYYPKGKTNLRWFPGAKDTLEGEVEVVLGWLAKAGYWTNIGEDDNGKILIQLAREDEDKFPTDHRDDNLHAALAAAVLALAKVKT